MAGTYSLWCSVWGRDALCMTRNDIEAIAYQYEKLSTSYPHTKYWVVKSEIVDKIIDIDKLSVYIDSINKPKQR